MPTNLVTDAQPIALPFTNVQLTQSINSLPPVFNRLDDAGLFPAEGMLGDVVEIVLVDGVITALPVADPAAPTSAARKDAEKAIYVKVPHVPHLITLLAQDIRGILEKSGGGAQVRTLASETNKYLQRLRRKFDITIELMRMSALKGVIVDGANTELYNLFTVFGVTKKTVDFALGTNTTNVQAKCGEVVQHLEDNISDEMMVGVGCYCDRTFFDNLINHPNVNKFWLQTEEAQALANIATDSDNTYRPRRFTFGNILFQEYNANVPLWTGSSQRMVATGKAHFYPMGTMDSHATYVAPPLDVAALNGGLATTTDLIHVTQETLKHGAGVELKGQANALPLWRRPALLVEGDDGIA